MPEELCFGFSGHAWCLRVGAPGEQEHGHVGVRGVAFAGMPGGFSVDRAAEEGPAVAIVILDVVPGVEQVAQAG